MILNFLATKLFNFLHRHSMLSFILIFLLTVPRNGFSLYYTMWKNFQSDPIQNDKLHWTFIFEFKLLFEFIGNSFGPLIYFVSYFLVVFSFAFLIFKQIHNIAPDLKLRYFLILTFFPVSTIILQRFGTYDAFCLLLAISGVITKNAFFSCLSGFIYASINPEAAFISGLGASLLILWCMKVKHSSFLHFQKWGLLNSVSQFSFGLILVVVNYFDGESAAEAILFVDSKKAFVQFLAGGLLLIYSWFGAFWFFLYKFSLLLNISFRKRCFGLIFLIGCITLIASDGTRNCILGLTSIGTLILFSPIGMDTVRSFSRGEFVFMYLIPAINVANFNIVLPFYQIIYVFNYARPYLIST